MKVRLRLDVEMKHETTNEDGEKTVMENRGILSTKTPQIITKANYKNVIKAQLAELKNKISNFDLNQSGWIFKKIHKIDLDVFETKPLRASSYIPTPEKYSNPKCGLVNIKNNDNQCFRWCMKYHQSDKQKNCQNISALKK